jgi:hypothetical protein
LLRERINPLIAIGHLPALLSRPKAGVLGRDARQSRRSRFRRAVPPKKAIPDDFSASMNSTRDRKEKAPSFRHGSIMAAMRNCRTASDALAGSHRTAAERSQV